ncbi:hypothetical protein TYRP_008266 [Tyrophagus putrescentiae]|nr:hypothetical protein TYRP_008266 [Tyrophagus putrescentiae]
MEILSITAFWYLSQWFSIQLSSLISSKSPISQCSFHFIITYYFRQRFVEYLLDYSPLEAT